jgi:hypothetical protein
MTDQSRLVRDLLDANLQLTGQLVELARLVIGAPVVETIERASMSETVSSGPERPPEFHFSSADDWEDIPENPMGGGAQILEIPRRTEPDADNVTSDLPLHMTEEEEDMRHAVAMSLRPSSDLSDLLKRLGTPGDEVIEFTAPEA